MATPRKKRALAAALIGLAFTVLCLAWRAQPSLSERRVPVAGEPAQARDLSRELDGLRRDIALLRVSRAAAVELPADSAPPSAATSLPEAPSDEPAPDTTAQDHVAYQRQIETTFQAEARDSRWADETERQIKDAVDELGPSTRMEGLTCATTMCKMVVAHDEETARQALPMTMTAIPAFQRAIFYSDEGLKTTLYIMRQDQRFPTFPN